jgi:putative sporulation protein YtaF
MIYLNLVLIALALNVDAVGVGISYGMRRIRLPLPSMLVISGVSMASIGISMAAGHVITGAISPPAARHGGGIILLAMGIFALCQQLRKPSKGPDSRLSTQSLRETYGCGGPLSLLQVRLPGLIIQVYKEPHLADMDASGIITGKEALLLGLSLSMDSLGAGIAISLLGYRILTTALCVGACQAASTYCGIYVGRGLGKLPMARQMAVLPGVILIILGLAKL